MLEWVARASFYACSDNHYVGLSPPGMREAALSGCSTAPMVAPPSSSKGTHAEGGVPPRSLRDVDEYFASQVCLKRWVVPFPTLQGGAGPCIRVLCGVLKYLMLSGGH